jgi:CRISPR-associated endonuclease Cas1
VDAGTLLTRTGFTHYPQSREEFRYFRGDLDRPARIILLDGSGSISFDVLDWLAEQEIPLIRISWTGEVVTVIGANGYSADREKIEWQRQTRANPVARLEFCRALIREKIANAVVTLDQVIPKSPARVSASAMLMSKLQQLDFRPPATVDALRGVEGQAAGAYFGAWQGIPLKWKSEKRRPIPEAWRTLGPRSSTRAEIVPQNRFATHPLNAMLNYAYAVLESQIRIQAVSEGYDPSIGIMHHEYRGMPAFVLDKMEPLRPVVDREVLRFALSNELHPADFTLTRDGACRLNPQLAIRVVQLVTVPKAWERSKVTLPSLKTGGSAVTM